MKEHIVSYTMDFVDSSAQRGCEWKHATYLTGISPAAARARPTGDPFATTAAYLGNLTQQ